MFCLFNNVFFGDREVASDTNEWQKHYISHLLTVDIEPLPQTISSLVSTYKFVFLLDKESENILDHLTECLEFINDGFRSGTGVLIHCLNGKSRSVAVATAWLMQNSAISFDEAYARICEISPAVDPNAGFIHQLRIFEQMGFTVDTSSFIYRQFRLHYLQLNKCRDDADFVDQLCACMADDPSLSVESSSGKLFRCRKCRRQLFSQSSFVRHPRGCGYASSNQPLQDTDASTPVSTPSNSSASGDHDDTRTPASPYCDQSLFVEPVRWMEQQILHDHGKVYCPKCNSKVGSFVWAGERCCCGSWVTPAFQIRQKCVE